MTRLDLSRTWTIGSSPNAARTAVERYLMETGLRTVAEDASSITADGGSQVVARMIGVWFVYQDAYPRRATVAFTTTSAGTRVRATIEERLGFALFDRWSRANYAAAFQTWLDGLGAALEGKNLQRAG